MTRDELLLLAESDWSGRVAALAKASEALSSSELELRAASAEVIAALGAPDESLPLLEGLADDSAPGVRLAAVAAAAGLPWKGRVELLKRKLSDSDPGIAFTAADGLAWAGEREVAPRLREFASHKRTRLEALEALFTLGDEAIETFAAATFPRRFAGHFEKALAAIVLAKKGDEKARSYLRERLAKRRAEERPFILIHLAAVDPGEGRRMVQAIARAEDDYLRESACLALARLDPGWWAPTQEAVGRYAESDPHVSAEVMLGLFDIDWRRASLIAESHLHRDSELGAAARRLRLQSALREAHASELLLRGER